MNFRDLTQAHIYPRIRFERMKTEFQNLPPKVPSVGILVDLSLLIFCCDQNRDGVGYHWTPPDNQFSFVVGQVVKS